jgi:hypothetical protein
VLQFIADLLAAVNRFAVSAGQAGLYHRWMRHRGRLAREGKFLERLTAMHGLGYDGRLGATRGDTSVLWARTLAGLLRVAWS